jgi:hypothetical protein
MVGKAEIGDDGGVAGGLVSSALGCKDELGLLITAC